jgi:hypothetical protein
MRSPAASMAVRGMNVTRERWIKWVMFRSP